MYLKPSKIFFTQSSIDYRFGKWCSHRKTYIGETLDDICNGRCSIGSIPRITVVKKDNKWFTLDNRRLWIYRHLERLGKCTEIEVNEGTEIPSRKFTTANGGADIKVRGDPDGIWHTKPSVVQLNITSEAEPETPSASSSTDGDIDIDDQKKIASEEIIEAQVHTENDEDGDTIKDEHHGGKTCFLVSHNTAVKDVDTIVTLSPYKDGTVNLFENKRKAYIHTLVAKKKFKLKRSLKTELYLKKSIQKSKEFLEKIHIRSKISQSHANHELSHIFQINKDVLDAIANSSKYCVITKCSKHNQVINKVIKTASTQKDATFAFKW